MSIIFQSQNFWIEALQDGPTVVNFGTNTNVDLNLERSGFFLSGAVTIGRLTATPRLIVKLIRFASAANQIAFGESISGVRIQYTNFDAALNEGNAHAYAVIFMRGRGR